MYHYIKILWKAGNTSKPTFYPNQDTPTIKYTPGDLMKVPSKLYDVKIRQHMVWNCYEVDFDCIDI